MTQALDAGIFEAWLASTDDGAIAIDASGQVVLHNPAASRVTGLAPQDAGGRPWRDVLHLDAAVATPIWEVRVSGRPTRIATEILCAQGNLRTAELTATPWRDAGERVGVLILIRDLAILCRQRTGPGGRAGFGGLVGADPLMQSLFNLIDAVAPSETAILIEGEPGVGKKQVAQLIHARSRRAERPLITVDCGALGPGALEVELFGRGQGAGGGAGSVIGRVELAHTGTLFLERVSELPLPLQTRLLRLLETGAFERGGDPAPRRADVRVVAGSAHPLEQAVRDGRFREDLWYRLRAVRLEVPPLRDRRADVPLLVDYFLARHGPPGCTMTAAALAVLQSHDLPGNVRQLEGALRQAIAALPPDAAQRPRTIDVEALPAEVRRQRAEVPADRRLGRKPEDRRSLLLRALSAHGGNRTAAARALGIGRATFYRWWREAGLA